MVIIERVAIIGAGTMGRQISLQAARNGLPVTLYDVDPAALEQARSAQQAIVAGWGVAGRVAPDGQRSLFDRLHYESDLEAALQAADLVIEAIPEQIDLKRELFAQLDGTCANGTIIATNSSSIRVSLLEDAVQQPERVANLHFFLPVWEHPMVEIGGGSRTTPAVLDALERFARRIGIVPLRVRRESTGFIFNRVWRAIKKEAMAVVDSGVATIEDVDRAWMIRFGTPQGPFGMMDEIGLDVIQGIEEQYARESGDPADRPPRLLTERVERGDLGCKTGHGFYTYPDPAYLAADFLEPGDGPQEEK